MASNSKGVGVLFVLGIVAIGYSNAGWGSPPSDADREAGVVDDGTDGDEVETCDGVVVVESRGGPAHVPADTSTATGSASTTCVMEAGEGDPDAVAALQDALARCHGQTVAADGRYGPATADAVGSVQHQAGLPADGVYGPATLTAMRWPVSGDGGCIQAASSVPPAARGTLPATG